LEAEVTELIVEVVGGCTAATGFATPVAVE